MDRQERWHAHHDTSTTQPALQRLILRWNTHNGTRRSPPFTPCGPLPHGQALKGNNRSSVHARPPTPPWSRRPRRLQLEPQSFSLPHHQNCSRAGHKPTRLPSPRSCTSPMFTCIRNYQVSRLQMTVQFVRSPGLARSARGSAPGHPAVYGRSQLVSYPGPEGVEPLSRRDTPTRARDSIIKRPNMCPQVNSKNSCYATVGITWFTNIYPEQDP